MSSRTAQFERRNYPCWAIVEPTPEGKWVAHCLEFDTLAQADDPETAARLVFESTNETVLEDLRAGANPLDRRTPDGDDAWGLLGHILDQPTQFDSYAELNKHVEAHGRKFEECVFAVQFILSYQREVFTAHLEPHARAIFPIQGRERAPAPVFAF